MREEWGATREGPREIDPSRPPRLRSGRSTAAGHEGREVAIKVQYPGVAEAVESDMRNLRMLSPMLRRLMPGPRRARRARRVARADRRGVRLRARGGRPPPARSLLARPPVRPVPDVDTELSRRRVLVTEWVDGKASSGRRRARRGPRSLRRDRLPLLLRDGSASSSLALGDPHPGNYLLQSDGRVAFFDFGMLRRLPSDYLARRHLRGVREDEPALVAGMTSSDTCRRPRRVDVAVLVKQSMRLVAGDRGPGATEPEDLWRGSEPCVEEIGGEMMEQLRRMTVPPEALLLRRMEGLLFQFA